MIHPIILRYTAWPLAILFPLPGHRTQVRLRGLLKCALSDGRLMPMRTGLLPMRAGLLLKRVSY